MNEKELRGVYLAPTDDIETWTRLYRDRVFKPGFFFILTSKDPASPPKYKCSDGVRTVEELEYLLTNSTLPKTPIASGSVHGTTMYAQPTKESFATPEETKSATPAYCVELLRTMLRGSVREFIVGAAPLYHLACDGKEVSRAEYAELFAIIGTMYGEGNGHTTFNLPLLTTEPQRMWYICY